MKSARPVRSKLQREGTTPAVRISNGASRFLIFSYGLFTIAAQALLFREFITTFEGNDISVGIFFGSWFLWVGLGAMLVYRAQAVANKLVENIEFLFLAYLPAFILELILIIKARELGGIEPYALLSVRAILLLSIVVNAPVSIITGMLFPTACRWVQSIRNSITSNNITSKGEISTCGRANGVQQERQLPVSYVYITEAAGGFTGGLGVTVLLGFGVSSAMVFLILAFVVCLSVSAIQLTKARQRRLDGSPSRFSIVRLSVYLLPLFVLLCLAGGLDKSLMRYVRVVKWTKLLPKDALVGSFQTAQAEYLYGVYHGQWIAIREGSVTEALPDEEKAGRIAATGLCQNPDAKRILVVGSGLGLCREFLRLRQIEQVTWAHCDSEYVQKVNRFIPPKLKINDERLSYLAGDVRSLLSRRPAKDSERKPYDIVILNLPDATSSVLNRYFTLEFYQQVKECLSPDGVLQVRIAGGENIMGTELINLGASTKLTLEKVFSQLVLTPGEDTWFIASDSQNLTGDPGTLRNRFARIDGGSGILAAEALLSIYLPGRAATAIENYSAADLPQPLLINRDSRPLTHLYSLLLAAKQSGAPITKLVKHLALAGPLAFLLPVLVFVGLRVIYILKTARRDLMSSFDSAFLVFSAGWVAIGVVISLMFLYQTRFGSLYLHIGVISSLFMVGLTAGAVLTSYLVKHRVKMLLFKVIPLHILILIVIAFWPAELWTHLTFAIAFVLCGLCSGSYFPLAAGQLAEIAFEPGQAGSKLETADHLGASAGGMVTSIALVPVLGTRATLFVFVLLILANVPAAALKIYRPKLAFSSDAAAFSLRRLSYILFGVGLAVILCSNLLAYAGRGLRPSLSRYAAQALAGESHIEQASVVIGDNVKKVSYFKVYEPADTAAEETTKEIDTQHLSSEPGTQKLTGYVFSSEGLADEVRGFGGKMNLAIYVDTAGRLINFHIIRSNETPSYLEMLGQWRGLLNGRELFRPRPLADVHAVTGATVSSNAILSALETSGKRFATQILGRTLEAGPREQPHLADYLPDTQGMYLISAFILTLIVIYRGGFRSRLAVLAFNLAVGGIILNAQYSSEQIATVLSLQTPAMGLSGAFLLAVGIPILVIFFGNIYCGYICPFGAAQELLGYVVGGRFKQAISAEDMRKARFVKYAVLFVLIIVFFISRNRTTLATDPLIRIFNFRFSVFRFAQGQVFDFQILMLIIAAVGLIGSAFYTRFWCRYLCPAGAFLSLFNKVVILKRYLPIKRFGRCEFGLTGQDQMDCLYCDRCRYERKTIKERLLRPRAPAKLMSRYFVAGVLIIAVVASTVSVSRFLEVIGGGLEQTSASAVSGGQARDVDLQRIRTMIRQGKLADREAEFYEKID